MQVFKLFVIQSIQINSSGFKPSTSFILSNTLTVIRHSSLIFMSLVFIYVPKHCVIAVFLLHHQEMFKLFLREFAQEVLVISCGAFRPAIRLPSRVNILLSIVVQFIFLNRSPDACSISCRFFGPKFTRDPNLFLTVVHS